MEKFNRYWMLKYSEHREQLKACLSVDVLSSIVYEVSYPSSFKGAQRRYVGASVCFDSFPVGVIIKRLTCDEVKRLYSYYQCDKSLCYK